MADDGAPRALQAAIDAVGILSPTRFTWLGAPFDLPEPVRRLAPPEGLRAALIQAVQWRLYADFFTSGGPIRPRPRAARVDDGGFARMLSAANTGQGATENGWAFAGTDGGRFMVERLGLRLWAERAEVVFSGPDPPRIGDPVSVRMANEAPRLSPGFYMTLSDVGLDPERPRLLDRYYIHVRPESAARCIAETTRRLNAVGLPFRLKVLDDPVSFERCDTAVLSLQRRQRTEGLHHVRALHALLRDELEEGVPALTLRMGPGLGFAEDPGDGVSFGAQRCGLIASALVEAHEQGVDGPGERMDVVRAHLGRAGTTPEAPYLGPRTAGVPHTRAGAPHEQEELAPCS